jgi:hypothetical protein
VQARDELAAAADEIEAIGGHAVRARTAEDAVDGAVVRLDGVVAALAGDEVGATAAVERVVAVAAEDPLRVAVAGDGVVAGAADDALDAARGQSAMSNVKPNDDGTRLWSSVSKPAPRTIASGWKSIPKP